VASITDPIWSAAVSCAIARKDISTGWTGIVYSRSGHQPANGQSCSGYRATASTPPSDRHTAAPAIDRSCNGRCPPCRCGSTAHHHQQAPAFPPSPQDVARSCLLSWALAWHKDRAVRRKSSPSLPSFWYVQLTPAAAAWCPMDAIPTHHLGVRRHRPHLGAECLVVHVAPLHCLLQVNRAGIDHQLVLMLGANVDPCVPRLACPLTSQ
jgi:hypothetical protein